VGAGSTTVNGVTFQEFSVPNLASSATLGPFTISGGAFYCEDELITGFGAVSYLSAGYQELLDSVVTEGNDLRFNLEIAGLTPGRVYEFQWWANVSIAGIADYTTAAAGGSSVALRWNRSMEDGGLGEFAIGTFVADAATQSIVFGPPILDGGFNSGLMNAFQLREVPEPSSAGLLLCGGLLANRRRRG
jgi:hypothetical protein